MLFVLLGLVTLGLVVIPGRAQVAPVIDASAQCKALVSTDFSQIPDAPTQVTDALLIDAAGQQTSYCRVQGYITPHIGIELRLPASGWNGKFLKVGCGGFCGKINAEQCEFAVRRGYACVASDMGHTSTRGDGKWAYNNLQAEVDFAYRATHVATLAGKAITESYYRKAPERSYFIGCSQGGRQGLVAAQRFPWDFDGIIAGAPVVDYTLNSANLLWSARVTQTETGESVLSPEVVKQVHETVLSRCDRDDGIIDGLIGNPQPCQFDPAELTCASTGTQGCLTNAQVDVVKKLYSGIITSTGEKLYWGAMPGSELNWLKSLINTSGGLPLIHESRVEQFKYMFFVPDPGPHWQAADFAFDSGYRRFGLMESLYTASNPDLRRFKAAGGKLLIYQGWNDELVAPGSVIDYYETVERTIGGRAVTQEFFRLFMLPAVNHCGGGAGADAIDYLTYMEHWVERDQSPDRLIGAHLRHEGSYAVHRSFPVDQKDVLFTRPVYPYPAWAKYTGAGDPNQADHFEPVTAK